MEPPTSLSPSAAAASSSSAAAASSSFSSQASSSFSSSWDETRLFVGGIPNQTTEQWLVEYFSQYGQVVRADIVKNKTTGSSRGFAFVKFIDSASAERALADTRVHIISGRTIEVKKAIPKYQIDQNSHDQVGEVIDNNIKYHNGIPFNPRKIFVGGLPPNLTEDEFRIFFEHFGEIKDAVLMHDNIGRLRGFGFIEFHSVDAVEKVLQKRFHDLKDKKVEVKRAVPKNPNVCKMEIGSGGRYLFDNDQAGYHLMHGPSSACLQQYVSPFFPGYTSQYPGFVGGYAVGCYHGIGSSSPYPSPLNSQDLVPVWQNLIPYGSTSLYPAYLDSGFSGCMNWPDVRHNATIWCGDNSNSGNWNQNSSGMQPENVADTTPLPDGDDKTSESPTDDNSNEDGKQKMSDMQSLNVENTTPHPDGDYKTPSDPSPQHDEAQQSANGNNSNGNKKHNVEDAGDNDDDDKT